MEQPVTHKSRDRFRVWLQQARYDLEVAQISQDNGFHEWACYQAVQSVEKALKAVIVHAGQRAPMTHKLGILISMCNHANELFLDVKLNFRKIEGYTFVSRYPFVYPGINNSPHQMISDKDSIACISIATHIYSAIESFLQKNLIQLAKAITTDDYYFSEVEVNQRLDHIVDQLLADQSMQLEKVILFGSFAREKIMPMSSTMDLIIIANTELQFIERIKHVRDLTHGEEPIVEPLVYTPEEFDFMLNEEGEGFVESAVEEGRVIYERKSTSKLTTTLPGVLT